MKSVVSATGRVTIPKPVRDHLDIRAGQVLDFEVEGDRLVAKKVNEPDPVAAVSGLLNSTRSSDEMIRELRGDADGL